MSKHKMIQPEDQKQKRDKRTDRIYTVVFSIYTGVLIAGLIIGGCYQHNDYIVGMTLIALGVLTIPVAIFCVCMNAKGLYSPLRFPDLPQNKRRIQFESNVETAVIIFAAVIFLVLGIIKLITL